MKNLRILIALIILMIYGACQNNDNLINENLLISYKNKNAIINEVYHEYMKNIKSIGFENIVTSEHLINDNDFSIADKKIIEAEMVFKNFNSINEKLYKDLFNIIDSIKPTKSLNSNDISKIRIILDSKFKDINKNREVDSLGIDAYKKIKDFLKSKCKFEIENNQIYFENEECKNEYFKLSLNLGVIQSKAALDEMKKKNNELQKKYGKY